MQFISKFIINDVKLTNKTKLGFKIIMYFMVEKQKIILTYFITK
jgi:hypothetical protein